MMNSDPKAQRYNLEDLAQAATLEGEKPLNLRTIRSWMKAGVVPGPDGLGQGKHYGEKHRLHLLCLQRIQIAMDAARLPLKYIKSVLPGIDEDTIRRVALGEEDVHILGSYVPAQTVHLFHKEMDQLSAASQVSHLDGGFAPSSSQTVASHAGQDPDLRDTEGWTTISITEDISLRLKGCDPEQVTKLAKMATHLREWNEDEL